MSRHLAAVAGGGEGGGPRAELAAAEPPRMMLPDESDGLPAVEWRPWQAVVRMTHVESPCEGCGAPFPTLATTVGLTERVIRWWASGCRRCGLVVVYEIGSGFHEVWRSTGQRELF